MLNSVRFRPLRASLVIVLLFASLASLAIPASAAPREAPLAAPPAAQPATATGTIRVAAFNGEGRRGLASSVIVPAQ